MSEKKKKVFISGPMSGIKDYNKPAFDKAEEYLTQAGYSVFNPSRMHFDDAWDHSEIMKIDLAALAQCDYICMLDKWYYSKGAIQEYHYANAIGVKQLTMGDIDNTKKEQKPRIEIETFGDISEENINILMLVERHYNELLATGGTITKVKITCEPKDESDTSKTCAGCKYHKYPVNEEPCKFCNPAFHTRWEPKDASTKLCANCRSHYEESLELCKSCNDKSNWTPKDAEK